MSRARSHSPADNPANRVLFIEAINAGEAGKVFRRLQREVPRVMKQALGLEVRNTQKSIAATVKNYAITSRVEGKRKVHERFRKRDKITVLLHGKKSDSALSKPRSVYVTSNGRGDGFRVGYKGRLVWYIQRWQDGGDTWLLDDKGALAMLALKTDPVGVLTRVNSPEVRHMIYKTLGSQYGIHNQAAIDEFVDDAVGQSGLGDKRLKGPAAAIVRRLVEGEESSLVGDVPAKWEGRPFMDKLAEKINERFVPSLVKIVDKILDGRIKRLNRGAG